MNKMQSQVLEFQRAMELPVGHVARRMPQDQKAVRHELIREELEEFLTALQEDDLVEQADALIDLLYVVYGGLVVMGIDAEPLFDEVHRSNMSKFGEDGKPIIAGPNDPDGIFEGRVKKGPNYFKPNLKALLDHGTADQDIAQATLF